MGWETCGCDAAGFEEDTLPGQEFPEQVFPVLPQMELITLRTVTLQPEPQFEPEVTAPDLQEELETAALFPEEAAAAQFAEAVQLPVGHVLPEVQPFVLHAGWETHPEPEQD